MEQVVLETISKHIKVMVMGNSQNRFIKGKSCFISLIAFYDKTAGLVDKGTAVDAVSLVFSNASGTQNILRDKLTLHGLDKWTGSTAAVISGTKSSWSSLLAIYWYQYQHLHKQPR